MPKVCLRYAWDILRYAWDMAKIFPRYAQDMPDICSRYAWDMSKICLRYALDMSDICPRYAQDMLKICLIYAWYAHDMPMISSWYAWDMPKICLRYVHGMPMICSWYSHDMPLIYQLLYQFKTWIQEMPVHLKMKEVCTQNPVRKWKEWWGCNFLLIPSVTDTQGPDRLLQPKFVFVKRRKRSIGFLSDSFVNMPSNY